MRCTKLLLAHPCIHLFHICNINFEQYPLYDTESYISGLQLNIFTRKVMKVELTRGIDISLSGAKNFLFYVPFIWQRLRLSQWPS